MHHIMVYSMCLPRGEDSVPNGHGRATKGWVQWRSWLYENHERIRLPSLQCRKGLGFKDRTGKGVSRAFVRMLLFVPISDLKVRMCPQPSHTRMCHWWP